MTLLQDLKFALRSLRKAPAFSLAAVVTLALGIGASTAIFSTVNAVLLRPLPYPNPENLYGLRSALTDGRVTTGMLAASEVMPLNNPELPIERAAGMQTIQATLIQRDGTPRQTPVYIVTEGFFELFGLPMTHGGFTPEHHQTQAGGPPVAVISHRIWTDMFESDPNIVGKPIRFAEVSTTIAGVAPKAFDTPHNADFWFNFRSNPRDVNHFLDGFMRLKPGANYERTLVQMEGVMRGVERELPNSAKARVYVVKSLVESIVGDLGPILLVVLSATGLLLLLACVNVTNLMLARGAARAREMAVRVALGAGSGRIVRQLMSESIVLAAVGAVAGVLVAYGGVQLLQSLGASRLPRLDTIPFDSRVLLFAVATLIVTGLLVGLAPALRLSRTDVRTLMNEGGRSSSAGRGTGRWLTAMTTAEIALAVTLVAGAGWLIRSFSNLQAIDPGFAADERMIFDFLGRGPRFADGPTAHATFNDVVSKLRNIPGVTNVGATSSFPFKGTTEGSLFAGIVGIPVDPTKPLGTRQRFVTPGFFDAAGIEILSGRNVSPDDRAGTPRVLLVNKTFVDRYLPGKNAIGVRFSFGYPEINPQTESEIIGVIEDVRQKTLVDAPEPAFYAPIAQAFPGRLTFVVQARRGAAPGVQSAIRAEMRAFDPEMAVDFQPVTEMVSSTIRRQELGMTLMLIFGAVAVALAAVGIYGVVAYAATEREHEVATRLALGASPMNVFGLVLKQGGKLAIIGTAIGLVIAYIGGRVISKSLYAITASDPLILSGAVLIVVAIAALATTIPAWRASRLNPAQVLHTE